MEEQPGTSARSQQTMSVATLTKPIPKGKKSEVEVLWEVKDGIVRPTILGLQKMAEQAPILQRAPAAGIFSLPAVTAKGLSYGFGRVFDETFSPDDVYNLFVSLQIQNAIMDGQDTTIFPIGPPGSGKSRFIFGEGSFNGVIYHAAQHICAHIESTFSEWNYTAKVSLFESVNGDLVDLTNDNTVMINEENGVFYPDAFVEREPRSMDDWATIIKYIQKKRKEVRTKRNDESSQSTVLVRIEIEGIELKPKNDEPPKKTNAIVLLVDATSSELKNIVRAVKEMQWQACRNEPQSLKLPNYCNSSIIKLLEPSFQGRAKIVMMCCIFLIEQQLSKNTLDFGMRVSKLPFHGKSRAAFSIQQCQGEMKELKSDQKILNAKFRSFAREIAAENNNRTGKLHHTAEPNMELPFASNAQPNNIPKPGCSQPFYAKVFANSARGNVGKQAQVVQTSPSPIPSSLPLDHERHSTTMEKLDRENQVLASKYKGLERQLEEERRAAENNSQEKARQIAKLQEELKESRKENILLKRQLGELERTQRMLEEKYEEDRVEVERKMQVQQANIEQLQADFIMLRTSQVNPVRVEVVQSMEVANSSQDETPALQNEELMLVDDEVEQPEENSQTEQDPDSDIDNHQPVIRRPRSKEEIFEMLFTNYAENMDRERPVYELVAELMVHFRKEVFWQRKMVELGIKSKSEAKKFSGKVVLYHGTRHGMMIMARILADAGCSDELVDLYTIKSAAYAKSRRTEKKPGNLPLSNAPHDNAALNEPAPGPSRTVNTKKKPSPSSTTSKKRSSYVAGRTRSRRLIANEPAARAEAQDDASSSSSSSDF